MKASLLTLLMITPLFLGAQSPKITTDKNTDWSPYKTFEVDEGELVTVLSQEIDKQSLLSEVRKIIISDMEGRGYTYAEESGDLLISFTGEAVETTNVEQIGPLGETPADQPIQLNQSRSWSQDLRQATLVIDMTDKGSNKSIWRASTTAEFGREDLKTVFGSAVGKSLRKIPRKKKK